jgi:hypothetical protein
LVFCLHTGLAILNQGVKIKLKDNFNCKYPFFLRIFMPMKKKWWFLYFLFFFAIHAYGQSDSVSIRLAGIVYTADTTEKAPYVHIINLRTGTGTISDSMGIFKIKLLKSDTLLIRCIGFTNRTLTLPDSLKSTICFMQIELSPKSYELNVVDIFALTRESQFRHDFINLKPNKNTWGMQLIIPGVTRDKYQFIREDEKFNPKQTYDGPISALYFAFSDKGKSLRKLAQLLEEEEIAQVVEKKYTKEELSRFTGFSGDKLDSFYNYLNFTNSYLFNTPTYEIYLEVKQNIPEFEIMYVRKAEP